MNISNCRSCKKIFNPMFGEKICPACKEKLEEKFQEVKKFIQNNPKAPIELIAQENEVSIKQIKQWVREERLTFDPESMVGIECELCGRMIRTGKYCDECKVSMTNTLRSAMDKKLGTVSQPKERRENGRMHYLQK